MRFRRELLKGNLATLILWVLRDQPQYANQIRRTLERRSAGAFSIPEGSIYPILHRLERKGLIVSEHKEETGAVVRVYRLTPGGEKELQYCLREWRMFSRAMDVALSGD
jgi:DNA-binding PadR family transcriptional regulator